MRRLGCFLDGLFQAEQKLIRPKFLEMLLLLHVLLLRQKQGNIISVYFNKTGNFHAIFFLSNPFMYSGHLLFKLY